MKKIMTFVLAMVLSVVAVFAFTGCGEAKKKLVVYTQ